MRSSLAVSAAVVLAVGLAAAALVYAVTANLTASIAAYAAGVATASLLNGVAQAARDRANLWFTVELTTWGPNPKNVVLQLRAVNRGRRPVKIEGAGLWEERGRPNASALPAWQAWGHRETQLQTLLSESESIAWWVWPRIVAQYYQHHPPSRFAFIDDSRGERHWITLDPLVVGILEQAWADRPALDFSGTGGQVNRPGRPDDCPQPVSGDAPQE